MLDLQLPPFTSLLGVSEHVTAGPLERNSLSVVKPGIVCCKFASKEVAKGPHKFMLGVNFPVVPAWIV